MLTLLGIAAPALLLFEAVRRWIAPVRRRFAWLFLALTLAFLHGAVFTSKLPLPVDEVARGYPWRGTFSWLGIGLGGEGLCRVPTRYVVP